MPFDLSTTWPWSAPGAEFAVVWLLLSGILMGVGVLVAIVVGDTLDGPVRTSQGAVSAMQAALTSVGVGTSPDTLLVGRFHRGDEVMVVAFLGGLPRLEAALFAAAVTAGWLRPTKGSQLQILDDVEPTDPILVTLKNVLQDPAAGPTPQRRLRTAALRVSPSLQTQAERLGLARSGERRSLLIVLALTGVFAAVVFALLRSTSFANVYLLGCAVAFHVVITLALVMPLTLRHRQARAYLGWLDGVMDAVRADVEAGAGATDQDIVLVAAVDGVDGLGAWGQRHGVDALRR